MGGPKEGRWVRCGYGDIRGRESSVRSHCRAKRLSALAADAARQLDVLRHDRHTLGVDGAQVGVLEEADEVVVAGSLFVAGAARSVARDL